MDTQTEENVETQEKPQEPAAPPAKAEKPKADREIMPVEDNSNFANLLDTAKFEHLYRVATLFSKSKMVPSHYQDRPADCMVACQMAVRLGVDPFMFMQNTYIVSGKPGMEAKLAIALVNSRGPFTGPIQWKFSGEGKGRACTAYATHKVTGELCEATVTWATVEAEGWASKAGSKWKTMPDMMFRYRSATFLARLYCPECLMGMMDRDEIIDAIDAEIVSTETADGRPRKFGFATDRHPEPEGTDAPPADEPTDTAPPPADDTPTGDLFGEGGKYADLITAVNDSVEGCTREKVQRAIDALLEAGLDVNQKSVTAQVRMAMKKK